MQLTRRHVLSTLMAGAVTRPSMIEAKPTGLRLAAEWEPHRGCVMALNDAADTYGNRAMGRMQEEQAAARFAVRIGLERKSGPVICEGGGAIHCNTMQIPA